MRLAVFGAGPNVARRARHLPPLAILNINVYDVYLARYVLSTRMPCRRLGQQGQAIDAMSRLLNALLDISKLESGAVKPDPADFALGSLLRAITPRIRWRGREQGAESEVAPCRGSVHSDRSLIEQILKNLVSNAIKYTRQGWVALNCRHESPSSVHIEVLDTGIGIHADHLRYIYDEFLPGRRSGQ